MAFVFNNNKIAQKILGLFLSLPQNERNIVIRELKEVIRELKDKKYDYPITGKNKNDIMHIDIT